MVDENLVLGLALATFAGLSLLLGLLVLYVRSELSHPWNQAAMAISFSVASGVMIYVAFVSLFADSLETFTANGASNPELLTSLSFFCGCILTALMDCLLSCFNGGEHGHEHGHGHGHGHEHGRRVGDDIDVSKEGDARTTETSPIYGGSGIIDSAVDISDENGSVARNDSINDSTNTGPTNQQLTHMSILTCLSMALHNMPEGLAVLIATLDDKAVGATLALAVILHNIPIGFSIAMSLYYVYHSKRRVFIVLSLVGLTQPLGAIVGYYIFKEIFIGSASAVLFAGVAGMMVYIALKELLPMAREYDTSKRLVTPGLFMGMVLVAVALVSTGGHSHGSSPNDHNHTL